MTARCAYTVVNAGPMSLVELMTLATEKGLIMTTGDQLYLHEQILLLCMRDHEGTVAWGTMYQYALGGAILAELLMQKRIEAEQTRKKLVNVVDTTPVGEPLLDECLDRIRTAKRRARLQTWVSRFASIKKLRDRVAIRLCDRGILRADRDKILHLFTRRIYPEVDHGPEAAIIENLRHAIFSDTERIDPKVTVLVSLASSASILPIVFDKKQLRKRKARIKQIVNGEVTGKAAKQAIDAMQAAVMVAAIMPAIMTTTVNTG